MHGGHTRRLASAGWSVSGWLGGVGTEHGRGDSIAWVRILERLISHTAFACGARMVVEGDRRPGQAGGDRRCFRRHVVKPTEAVRRLAPAALPAVMERQRREFRASAEGA